MSDSNDLVASGERKIRWAASHMPVVSALEKQFASKRPFEGASVSCCLHLEAKTAYMAYVLHKGGAQVALCGSNPLTTQDDVAYALHERGITVNARYGIDDEEYYRNLNKTLDIGPSVIIDDGGDLAHLVHTERDELLPSVRGLCEETTTGVIRLKAMEREGSLKFPAFAVNDAKCKYLFDNRYGTGQSTLDGIMRTTNLIIAGKVFVVAGYGWCGRGIAMRAKGLGANVVVTEVDPIKAIEAHMDGFRVMTMDEAAPIGDIFVTATGCNKVIRQRHFITMKDGAILANAGHFNVEVDVVGLEQLAEEQRFSRKDIMSYRIGDKWLHLLGEGRLVNLACADGHPAEIMDMSFALQLLCATHILGHDLEPRVYGVPHDIDERVARMRLSASSISIDELDEEQCAYLSSWRHGT